MDETPAACVFRDGIGALDAKTFPLAKHGLFSTNEVTSFEALGQLVRDYLADTSTKRPLSVAIFGAPGSGKSRLAKALPEALQGAKLATLVEINLTQLRSAADLAGVLAGAHAVPSDPIPFVFFDEFDATRDGARWGWLSWFLALMQDGAFWNAGSSVAMNKAVLVFAGGTASSYAEFGTADRAAFTAAKGPDFVSRLRGFIDLEGVNSHEHREVRRASTLHFQLGKKLVGWIPAHLRDALLYVGRYKHGARSMESVSTALRNAGEPTLEAVSRAPEVQMHVDRGPLDPSVIGGCIGLSAGTNDRGATASSFDQVWKLMTTRLFDHGAQIAYGGNSQRSGLTELPKEILKGRPQTLLRDGANWLVVVHDGEQTETEGVLYLERPPKPAVDHARLDSAVGAFRMCHQLELRSVARFAIGGGLTNIKRYPGVVEELMLALAMRHPIYVVGAFGGGARWAGTLLGLGRTWLGPPEPELPQLEIADNQRTWFRPPPHLDLPITPDDLVAFLSRHALGGPLWPDNGLDDEDNRLLFESTDPGRIADLVVRGLRARFAT